MKKRILSILLMCCMVLTLLPTTAFAADESPAVTNVTVTFDSDGGSAVEPQSVPQGQLVQRPADPIKDGHTFIGWYNKADLQYINLPEWNFDYPVFENMELVAQWMEARPISTDPVAYLDENGQTKYCTAYTVLTSETRESILDYDDKWYDLPAGWYVVEGDVTITPRLDTHGAVNLILTNGSHLTAEWGIDVKVGDTFTVYAQSTDEGTMGRLTACLPADFNLDRMVHYSVWPYSGMAGIGSSARWRAGNDGIRESEGTIIINGGNIRAKGQNSASAIGGPLDSEIEFRYTDRGEVYNRRQGGSITINGGIVRTEPFALPEGNPLAVTSVGIGTCHYGYGGSVTINGGTVIAEAANDAITTGDGGTITINGGDVTARGGVNNFGENSHRVLSGNGIGPLENGSITINGGTVKATAEGKGFGIGGSRFEIIGTATVTINGGTIEATANHNNAAIGDRGKGKSGVTITGGVIHAVGKGGAAGIGSKGDIRITGGELTVSAEGSGAAIGGFTNSYSERVDCKSITINGDVIKSISSKDGACIGAAAGGSVGSIAISNAELSSLSAEKILIGWDADSPGGKLTIRNCRVASTDILSDRTDGIRVGSNSELVIENSEIRLPHLRGIRVGGNGSIAVRDSDLHTYGIFMDETVHTITDAKTLKKLEITDSTVLTGDIIGARGEYSSVEEVVIRGSSIRLNEEYTYNYCTIGGGTKGSFGSIDIQNSQIHIPSPGLNTAIGNGHQADFNRESHIRIANSQVFVGGAKFGPAIGAAYGSSGGQINILIENSTVTAKGGNLRSDTDYIPGIGKNSSGRASEIGKIQILNSTVESFRLEEKDGTNYVYDDLHEKNLPGIPAENISICGSTVNGTRIDHSFDEYGKCALCGKYDLGYCYEHGLLTMEGLTDCVSDGSEKKLTGLSHQTGENETKQLTENTDYTAIYSNNVHPYTLKPDDEGFDSEKAPKVTLYGTGNYCGKAEHYFTISTEAPAAEHTVTVRTDGNGTASASHAKAAAGTEITLTATPNEGYHFKEWEVMSGGVTIKDDKFTMPSANVEVKAIFKDMSKEQFTLAPGGTYYFDLSAMGIPGTVNDALPDKTMRYVPFTYAGTVDSYKLTSEMATTEEYAQQSKYAHGLFIADFAVTHEVSWDNLNAKGLIFGKGYATGSVDYTLRAPSGGSGGTGSGALERGTPQSNEWDRILDKDDGYIKNWRNIGSWGQDTLPNTLSNRVIRGQDDLPRTYAGANTTLSFPFLGFRPVLEVLNPGTLGSDGLKAVTLDLGGGKLGGSSDTIQIIVKTGESFTAPASEGLTRPDGNTGSSFKWLGSDGNLYAPGESVPADVIKLTAQFAPTITTDTLPDGKVGEAYSHILTADGTTPITWSVDGGLPASLSLNKDTGEISGTPTAEGTSTFTVKAENSTGSVTKELSITIAKDAPTEHTVTVTSGGNGTASASPSKAVAGAEITLSATPDKGYHLKEWQVISGGVTIVDDKFTMPDSNVEVKAIFEEDAPPAPTEYTVTVTSGGNGTASASPAKAVAGAEITLTATPDKGYHLKEWQVESPTGLVITNNKFTMPDSNVEVTAIFEKDAPPAPTDPAKPSISVTGTYTYNGSEHTAAVNGYDPATMDISGNTATDAGDYTVRVTSKTGKWVDGSTDAVTAAWSIGKATQEAPNGLIGVAPTTEGGSDGKITGVDATMEYRAESEITYTACTGIEIENLPAGNYFVRYAEDRNHFASSDAEVTVGEGTPLADCTITFNAGGGSGNMDSVIVKAETNYILPACGFTAPADQEFKAWEISGTEYKVGDSYTVNGDIEIKALWKNSVITPTTYTVTVGNDGNGTGTADPSTAVAGTEITLTATPNKGYHFKVWQVMSGGVTIKDDKFLMPNDNVEVRAIFEEDAPPAPTEFTITVKTDGNGTASASLAKAAAGTEITLTATPKEGYHFKEWQVESPAGLVITNNQFTMPNDIVEVKAIFEKDAPPAPTEFIVTVKTDGNGTASASLAKAAAGTTIILTATPNTGYHFKEWKVMSGGVTIKDDKFIMPSTNVEVKAIFEKDAPPAPTEFTVIFDGNGGTPSVGSMTTTNQKLTSLPSASRSGSYSFDGWYTEKSGGTKITTATVFSAKTTVYAHWTYTGGGGGGYNPPVTYYTLRFETGGGSDIPSVRESYNTYIDLTKYVPTWRGHTFIGWYTERSLTNKVSGVYLTKDMTVYAGWRVDENPNTGANPFTDVSEKDWFYGDVMFVYENGLMLGTSKTLFSPHGTATRGMMATILWRMEGSPAPKGKNSFADVEAGKWYADAITWTAENGIFAGYGKDKFGPDDPITREQLAAIFYRYADYKGYDLTVKGNLDKFKDADKITDYAKTAMQWAVGSGLVKGKSGNLLDPQGTATRAEIAAMLHRFIEKYELVQGKAPGGLMGWIDPKRLQIPKTGDSSVLGLWGISLCTSLAGCLALTTWQIRRRREEEALQIIEK